MSETFDLPIHSFATPELWRIWLEEHASSSDGIWLLFYKKDSGIASLNYAQALDEALCFGWIDGQLKKGDEQSWYQRFTPRRPRSVWSEKNTQNVDRLIRAGKMTEAGMREVHSARADGRWTARYSPPSKGTPPKEFIQMLEKHPKAKAFYATLNKQNIYAIYYRIHTAKREETRQNRMKMFVAMLEKEQKPYP